MDGRNNLFSIIAKRPSVGIQQAKDVLLKCGFHEEISVATRFTPDMIGCLDSEERNRKSPLND